MLTKTVKITLSPFNPNIAVVGPMIFDVRSPYSDKSVTLVVNPNISHYEESPKSTKGIKIRQAMITRNTEETLTIQLELTSKNEQTIKFRGKIYKVKLLNVGKEKIEGQGFPYFEFFVEEQ